MTLHPKRVKSTGAVSTPTEPIVTEQAVGRSESTGAEEFDAEPKVLRAEHLGQEPTGAEETPGPVTRTLDWLTDAEAKVVGSPSTTPPPTGQTRAETKGGVRGPTSER